MIRRKKVILAVTCLYVLLLSAASLLPSGTRALGGWDLSISPDLQNALHVPAYAALQILATLCVWSLLRAGLAAGLWVALACCLFGSLLECAQAFIPGRMASLTDVLLNLAGVAAGFVFVAALPAQSWPRGLQQ